MNAREESMATHEATWAQLPDSATGSIGQYYCGKCKLLLLLAYNQHYVESTTGWHWEIQDANGQVIESAGNKHVSKYELAVVVLDDVREEGLRKFDSLPCQRSN
jgi:hypothetical protein